LEKVLRKTPPDELVRIALRDLRSEPGSGSRDSVLARAIVRQYNKRLVERNKLTMGSLDEMMQRKAGDES